MQNALDAMFSSQAREKGKGKLIIRAELAFSTKEDPHVAIHIADTGPGMAEEKLKRLFHPFFTTKENGAGNGLGLYLTRELVIKNRGEITASSFQGCGTTFSLEFPMK